MRQLLFIGVIGLLAGGCQTYVRQERGPMDAWRQSAVQVAAQEFSAKAQKSGGKDAVVWNLEAGAAWRAAGQFDQSIRTFDVAEAKIDAYEQQARVKVGREAAALLSNQENLPYTGYSYDKIMLDTYKALDELQMGQIDRARVDLIRAYQRQQDAVHENARKIEKAQNEQSGGDSSNDQMARQAQSDPAFKSRLDGAYTALDSLKPYADYVNPFTVYLDGLFYMATATDGSDLQHAQKSLQRVAGYDAGNPYVRQDLQTVDDLIAGRPLSPTTYVIFENGLAPARGQVRIDIPLFLAGVRDIPYVGAAFPILTFQDGQLPSLTVTAGGVAQSTAMISSMDSVIGREFKNEIPSITAKTILSTIVKGAATYALNHAADQQSPVLGVLSRIGTSLVGVAINIADTRTWTTLPKEFQVCRVPTPPDRQIEVSSPFGGSRTPVTLLDGTINVVYVKSISQGGSFEISQFKLK